MSYYINLLEFLHIYINDNPNYNIELLFLTLTHHISV